MEYSKDEFWSKEKILKISQLTGLTESQVYKWCWDQKKKVEDSPTKKKSAKAGLKDAKSNDKM